MAGIIDFYREHKDTQPTQGSTHPITSGAVYDALSQIKQFTYTVVDQLPEASESTMYCIYFAPAEDTEEQNIYNEYITVFDDPDYVWECIGSTAIDTDTIPQIYEVADVTALTNDFIAALKPADVVVEDDTTYIVTFKDSSKVLLTYFDGTGIEEIEYDVKLPASFGGVEICPAPLYYDGEQGYIIKDNDWNHSSYGEKWGKTDGSYYHNITNVSDLVLNDWRLPTRQEIENIINSDAADISRTGSIVNNTNNAYYAFVQITDATHGGYSSPKGLIIFPDNKTISGKTLSYINSTSGMTDILNSELNEYLNQGCAFLPCSGYYQNNQWRRINEQSYYATSTPSSGISRTYMFFISNISGNIIINTISLYDYDWYANPVRLVRTIDPSAPGSWTYNKTTSYTFPLNVSDLPNDAGYLSTVNQSMPSSWNKSGTMAQLITSIQNDTSAVAGMTYLDTVSISDLPTGLAQAEMIVEITKGTTAGNKIIVFTIDSEDISPYHWRRVAAYNRTGYWRAMETQDNKVTSLSGSSTDAQYPSAKCVYDIIGNIETLLSNI